MVGGYLYHVYEQVIEHEVVTPEVTKNVEKEVEVDGKMVTQTESVVVTEEVVKELVRFELRCVVNSAGEAQAMCEGESGKFVYTYTQCWWGMPN